MGMCVRKNRMKEENKVAVVGHYITGFGDFTSLKHWAMMRLWRTVWGRNKRNQLVMQHSVVAMRRCKRFNGNGALWCVKETWPAGLEAGWSWEQDTNETQEYSAGLKSRAHWCTLHKEELRDPWLHKQHTPWVCTLVIFVWERLRKWPHTQFSWTLDF